MNAWSVLVPTAVPVRTRMGRTCVSVCPVGVGEIVHRKTIAFLTHALTTLAAVTLMTRTLARALRAGLGKIVPAISMNARLTRAPMEPATTRSVRTFVRANVAGKVQAVIVTSTNAWPLLVTMVPRAKIAPVHIHAHA